MNIERTIPDKDKGLFKGNDYSCEVDVCYIIQRRFHVPFFNIMALNNACKINGFFYTN